MSVLVQNYETAVPVDTLSVHPANPRRGDVASIVASIDANGFYGSIIAQRSTGYVLAGNHRLLAARERGIESLPVIWVDVDDDRARRILLVDNRSNDLASYDEEQLVEVLRELGGDLSGTGYDDDALAKLIGSVDPSFDPVDETNRVDVSAEHECPECGHTWRVGADGKPIET